MLCICAAGFYSNTAWSWALLGAASEPGVVPEILKDIMLMNLGSRKTGQWSKVLFGKHKVVSSNLDATVRTEMIRMVLLLCDLVRTLQKAPVTYSMQGKHKVLNFISLYFGVVLTFWWSRPHRLDSLVTEEEKWVSKGHVMYDFSINILKFFKL